MGIIRDVNKGYILAYEDKDDFEKRKAKLASENAAIYKSEVEAEHVLEKDPLQCGEKIGNNKWKYDLPQGWRLLYSLDPKEKVVHILAGPFDHKEYEKALGGLAKLKRVFEFF